MIDINDIRSLTDFQRNAKAYTRRLTKTGRPMILTVNGKPGIVVQDAEAYQELLKKLEWAQHLDRLRESIRQGERGESAPAEEAFDRMRKKHGIPRKSIGNGGRRH